LPIDRICYFLESLHLPWRALPGDCDAPAVPTYLAQTDSAILRDIVIVGSMDSVNVSELVARLGADEESVRKMAVFKLQNAIGDPSFADVFIYEGGLPKLRFLALHSTGNTLAYCLTSLARLLELDKGWDHVTDDLIVRVSVKARVRVRVRVGARVRMRVNARAKQEHEHEQEQV
jgi:engulfment/cell motility protein 1